MRIKVDQRYALITLLPGLEYSRDIISATLEELDKTIEMVRSSVNGDPEPTKKITEVVLDYIRENPRARTVDVAKAIGMRRQQVSAAIKNLSSQKKVVNVGYGKWKVAA